MLIIIESPNKIKKIAEYSKAKVKATVGHFKDLPKDNLGIEVDNDYKPVFVYDKKKKNVIDEIKKLAKNEVVYIATDPDREGYAIGTFIYQEIKNIAKEIYRAEIHEITKKGVEEALKKAIPFEKTNRGLFNAFLGRRVGDRIVGYILSPITSKELQEPFSVGRVQSPAVRLVVEREREIRNFKSTPYYVIKAVLNKGKDFIAIHSKSPVEKKEEAEKILNRIKSEKQAVVKEIIKKKQARNPKPPFTTSDLQVVANSQLKFSPEKTMQLAQDLFEAGLITYHRTDSVRISDEFIDKMREFIKNTYTEKYLPEKPNSYKSKNSQAEAHEAIRPTGTYPITEIPRLIKENGLTEEHGKLLELIWKRTIASQMKPAIYDVVNALFQIGNEEFKATGRVLIFDGFLKVYQENEEEEKQKEEEDNQSLPELTQNEKVAVKEIKSEEKWTKPPSRYNEGSLVKMLEKLGIGRPSTYASIMKTIKARGYVKVSKGQLIPTEKGEKLIDYLDKKHKWIIDYEFTKQMEEFLDEVEENKKNWKEFVRQLHERLNFYIPDKDNKPSEKQVEFAKSLAEKTGLEITQEILENKNLLSEWIDKAMKQEKPSDKQIELAKSLSEKTGMELPDKVLDSKKLLSEWIDKTMKQAEKQRKANLKLSEKQIEILKKNGQENLINNPEKALKWLDGYFKKNKKNNFKKK